MNDGQDCNIDNNIKKIKFVEECGNIFVDFMKGLIQLFICMFITYDFILLQNKCMNVLIIINGTKSLIK